MNSPNLNRRKMLIGSLIGVAGISGLTKSHAASEKLNPADQAAKNVGYVEDAAKVDINKYPNYIKGQVCANCALALSAYGPIRPCKLFPGKLITAKGWCSAWARRPAGT